MAGLGEGLSELYSGQDIIFQCRLRKNSSSFNGSYNSSFNSSCNSELSSSDLSSYFDFAGDAAKRADVKFWPWALETDAVFALADVAGSAATAESNTGAESAAVSVRIAVAVSASVAESTFVSVPAVVTGDCVSDSRMESCSTIAVSEPAMDWNKVQCLEETAGSSIVASTANGPSLEGQNVTLELEGQGKSHFRSSPPPPLPSDREKKFTNRYNVFCCFERVKHIFCILPVLCSRSILNQIKLLVTDPATICPVPKTSFFFTHHVLRSVRVTSHSTETTQLVMYSKLELKLPVFSSFSQKVQLWLHKTAFHCHLKKYFHLKLHSDYAAA